MTGKWPDDLRAAANGLLDRAKASAIAAGVGADTVLRDSFSQNVGTLVSEEARPAP